MRKSGRLIQLLLFLSWHLCQFIVTARISCYTCQRTIETCKRSKLISFVKLKVVLGVNDFVVWNWRHYFLKRNYHIASSDNACADRTAFPDKISKCSTSCFLFYVNGTDKTTGVSRGCSGQFLTNEQYFSRSLGVQSRPSEAAHYLPHSYDKYDIWEHWCFCASDYCNVDSCFAEWRYSSSYGYAPLTPQRRYQGSHNHERRRTDSDNYSDYVNSYWAFYNIATQQAVRSFLTVPLAITAPLLRMLWVF